MSGRIVFEVCTDAQRAEAALGLAVETFGGADPRLPERISLLRSADAARPSQVLAGWDERGIAAMLLLVGRDVRLGDSTLQADGITLVCVREDLRGSGVGHDLVEDAVRVARTRRSSLLYLFARRALDGYYTSNGFVGTGLFTSLDVEVSAADGQEFTVRRAGISDATDAFREAYRASYASVPLSFVRDDRWWSSADDWLASRGLADAFHLVEDGDAPLGYALVLDGVVSEMACLPGREADLCSAVASRFGVEGRLAVAVHPLHPCSMLFQAGTHSLSLRRAWTGGHMTLVLDEAAVCDALAGWFDSLALERSESLAALRADGTARDPLADISLSHSWSALDEI